MDKAGNSERDYSIPGMQVSFTAEGESDAWPLVVRTAQPQPWQAYEPDPFVAVQPVATTILYRTQAWRIHEIESREGEWFYRMRPWPAEERWMQTVELDRQKMAEAAQEKIETKKIVRLAHWSVHYELVFGWLPASVQIKLSQRMHFSPSEASKKNGLLFFFVGCALTYVFNLLAFFMGDFDMLPNLACWGAILSMDGALRWAHALTSRRPCGWLVFELPIWLYRRLRRRPRPTDAEYDS